MYFSLSAGQVSAWKAAQWLQVIDAYSMTMFGRIGIAERHVAERPGLHQFLGADAAMRRADEARPPPGSDADEEQPPPAVTAAASGEERIRLVHRDDALVRR